MAKDPKPPRTRQEKGRTWATWTLVLCGAFSIWANVRSGVLQPEYVIVSVYPPVVSFFASHLITYFRPKNWVQKTLIWAGMGVPVVFSMGVSGTHIVTSVAELGQNAYVAWMYVFITDVPMLVAGVILATNVSGGNLVANPTTANQTGQRQSPPAKKATPAKQNQPPRKAQPRRKPTASPVSGIPQFSDPRLDPLEKEMLDA